MTESSLDCSARKEAVATRRYSRKRPTRKSWLESYSRLKEFYRRHGHSNVPQRYPDDPSLGTWVSRQRGSRHRHCLTDEQRELLAEVEFSWELQNERFDRLWNESYEKLREYKAKHGNCDVPTLYGRDRPRALGCWVSMQKRHYHQGLLREDRKRMLCALDFAWEKDQRYLWSPNRDVEAQELLWQENYEKLVAFTQTYGHTLVPNLFVNGKAECLGRWVRSQRSSYLQGTLPDDRKKLLEELGFVWRVLARGHSSNPKSMSRNSWKEMYSRLVSYRKVHGDCLVPSDYAQDEVLARWVQEVRLGLQNGSIHPARIERLDAIGFLMTKENYATFWNEQFENLVSYRKQHNTTVISHTSAGRLLHWTNAQRYLHRRRLLTEEQEDRLQSIGFDWSGQGSSTPLVSGASTAYPKSHEEWVEFSDDESVVHDNNFDSENAVNPRARPSLRDNPLAENRHASEMRDIAVEGRPSKQRRLNAKRSACQYQSRTASSLPCQGCESSGPCRVEDDSPASRESKHDSKTVDASINNPYCADRLLPLPAEAGRLEGDVTSVATDCTDRRTKLVDGLECHDDSQEAYLQHQSHSHTEQGTLNTNPAHSLYSICELIDDANQERERIDCTSLYPVGTRVRKLYDGYGWVPGEIVQFEGVYRVRYEDGDEEDFLHDDEELADIVSQANTKVNGSSLVGVILPVGTPVRKYFPLYGCFAGEIIAFDGVYLVRHDDGDEEELFYDSPELATIVDNAIDPS